MNKADKSKMDKINLLLKQKKVVKKSEAELNKLIADGNKDIIKGNKSWNRSKWFAYFAGFFAIAVGFSFNSIPFLSKINVLLGTFVITNTLHLNKSRKRDLDGLNIKTKCLAAAHKELSNAELKAIDKKISELKTKGAKK